VAGLDPTLQIAGACLLGGTLLLLWLGLVQRLFYSRFLKKWLRHIDGLTPLPNQTRRDSWAAIRDLLYVNLKNTDGRYSLAQVIGEHAVVKQIHDRGSREIREALKELTGIAPEEDAWAGGGAGPMPYWASAEAPVDGR
ncbi:MAG TPA: hypothetical protein VLT88_11070, partial [Desulfosarcina sp.]|nr:hypothetical protein [Desulfosarcina sp.]